MLSNVQREWKDPGIFALAITQVWKAMSADESYHSSSVIILYCLAYGSRRYSEIQRRIDGISQKVLTQSLRKLERHGLIERQVVSEMPLNVTYSLTSLGETLTEPLWAISDWSRTHFSEIEALRAQYDRDHVS